jgi:hypothetical protein
MKMKIYSKINFGCLNRGLKQLLFITFMCFSVDAYSYTFRIQEVSTNPNCSGYYCVRESGSCVSPLIQYSYPSNVNRVMPLLPQVCYSFSGSIPDEISFINISSCSPGSFTVPLSGVVNAVSCNCHIGQGQSMHNFSATIQADPLGTCDYLITIYY